MKRRRYVTLGADEGGQVYGLELGEDGKWERNSLGLSTSCAVVRPVSKEDVSSDDPLDKSFVFELLDDEDNPTVHRHDLSVKKRIDEAGDPDNLDDVWDEDGQPISFWEHLKKVLLESTDVDVSDEDDLHRWEGSGLFPPKKPFVVEFAPRELLEEYYAHLRETYKEFKG